jgi:hypothetical protein
VVVALGCNAAGEGGHHGGRNGWRGVAKLSSVLLQNGGKGSGGSSPGVPTWRRGKQVGSGHEWRVRAAAGNVQPGKIGGGVAGVWAGSGVGPSCSGKGNGDRWGTGW